MLDAHQAFGAVLVDPIKLPDGRDRAVLLLPGYQRVAAVQRFCAGEVRMLCVVAITDDEYVFARNGGGWALPAALKSAGLYELCDLSRPSLVPHVAARTGQTS